MTDARAEIIQRIRTALADRPVTIPIPRDYRTSGGAGDLHRFAQRVEEYHARVYYAGESVGETIAAALAARSIDRVIVPDGFPEQWLPPVQVVHEPVELRTLDEVGAVLSTCRVAIAETGTMVLDADAGMGRRALTLVPDYHCIVVHANQILALVPDAVAMLDATRPLTWISGPSATSDIELTRVEGVHGPRCLDVVLAD